MSHHDTPLTPATEEMTSPGDEMKRTAFLDLPTPRRASHLHPFKAKSAKNDKWHGEVHGEMHGDRDALLAIIQTITAVKQRALEEVRDEEDREKETSSDEGTDNAEATEAEPGSDSDTMPLLSGKLWFHTKDNLGPQIHT